MSERESASLLGRRRLERFSTMFASLLLLIVVPPLLPAGPVVRWGTPLVATALLLTAIRVSSERRHALWIGIGLVVPAIAFQWFHVDGSPAVEALGRAATILFLVYAVVGILRHVLRARVVDGEVVVAALCAYLLFGVIWGQAYELVASLDPTAFSISDRLLAEVDPGRVENSIFTYFSFVTIATLGYGDVSPVSAAARSLAIGEVIVGQIYLVTMIARLVSIQVSREQATPEP